MQVKISVAIITKNEEKNIGRCLESIKDIADDIVIVDTFSTDKTEEIARQYNARFIQNPFDGHIQQKNVALNEAKYNYVLSLDADEALNETLQDSVRNIKKNWMYDGYSMNRLNNYCGQWIRHSGWYPDRKIRLLDRRKGFWGGTNPHDRIIMKQGAKTDHLKGDILHYSYSSISQHIRQMNAFTDIMAKEAFKKGKKAGFLNIFISPGYKFIKKYILQQGFRDGYYGLVISILSVFYTFMKYLKLRELNKNKSL